MIRWPARKRTVLWFAASSLLCVIMLLFGTCPVMLLPLVSATSLILTYLLARFDGRAPQGEARSDLLQFFTDLSVEMSSGMSAEAALSKMIQGGNPIVGSAKNQAMVRLMSGGSADDALRSASASESKDDMKDFYLRMMRSGNADIVSATPFLDLWAENLSLVIESRRSFEEISRRAEFLHYLISFTMGFLAASASLMGRLRPTHSTYSTTATPFLMLLSLLFLEASVFTISSRKFQFSKPLLKFAVGTVITMLSFFAFTKLFSLS